MKNVVVTLSRVVFVIAILNIFAWSISHVVRGGERFGVLTKPMVAFTEFPTLVYDVFAEVSDSETLFEVDENFKSYNNIPYDLYTLNASYNDSRWDICLANLRNDSIIYKWFLEESNYLKSDRVFSHAEPIGPIVLKDTSLVLTNNSSFNIYRLSASSKVLWHNTKLFFHHAINPDSAGNIWACTSDFVKLTPQNVCYSDNYLTKIDITNGKVLYHKSLSELFFENNLGFLTHGYGNIVGASGDDPFHLNEIEPVLESGQYMKEGDLFISLRHRSMIIQYRPMTNKVIRIIQGPFLKQHDVDILSDSTISLFNNNQSGLQYIEQGLEYNAHEDTVLSNQNPTLNRFANVQIYNLKDSSFCSLYHDQFLQNKLFTGTQGLHHILTNGDLFVEDWDDGTIFIFNEDKTLVKKYFNDPVKGRVEPPHWVRLYENLNFLK